MIATVKIIPFAVAGTARDQAVAAAEKAKPVVRVAAPYKVRKSWCCFDAAARPRAKGCREDAQDHRDAHCAGRCIESSPSGACRMSRLPSRVRSMRCSKPGAELVIVFGASAIADRAQCDSLRRSSRWRRDRAFRDAGGPGKSDVDRQAAWTGGAWRARLRTQPEGKWVRLGADAPARRLAGHARRYNRHGRWRFADGDRHASAAT